MGEEIGRKNKDRSERKRKSGAQARGKKKSVYITLAEGGMETEKKKENGARGRKREMGKKEGQQKSSSLTLDLDCVLIDCDTVEGR